MSLEEKNSLIEIIRQSAIRVDEIDKDCKSVSKCSIEYKCLNFADIKNLNKKFNSGKAKNYENYLFNDGIKGDLSFQKIFNYCNAASLDISKNSAVICCLTKSQQPYDIEMRLPPNSKYCNVVTIGTHITNFHEDDKGPCRFSVLPYCQENCKTIKLWVIRLTKKVKAGEQVLVPYGKLLTAQSRQQNDDDKIWCDVKTPYVSFIQTVDCPRCGKKVRRHKYPVHKKGCARWHNLL